MGTHGKMLASFWSHDWKCRIWLQLGEQGRGACSTIHAFKTLACPRRYSWICHGKLFHRFLVTFKAFT